MKWYRIQHFIFFCSIKRTDFFISQNFETQICSDGKRARNTQRFIRKTGTSKEIMSLVTHITSMLLENARDLMKNIIEEDMNEHF